MTRPNYHNIQSFSDQHQDLFILACTKGKRNGTYLEIGGGHPVYGNNTFLLEQQFGWSGLSFEMKPELVNEFNLVRRNRCLIGDATVMDYNGILERCNAGPHLDYLQVDIDPAHATLAALKQIDLKKYSFSVVTFEHDIYNKVLSPAWVREESREILQKHGYTRVISDVVHAALNPYSGLPHGAMEDWYVHEDYIGNDVWKRFVGENVPMDPGSCSEETKKLFEEVLKDIV